MMSNLHDAPLVERSLNSSSMLDRPIANVFMLRGLEIPSADRDIKSSLLPGRFRAGIRNYLQDVYETTLIIASYL